MSSLRPSWIRPSDRLSRACSLSQPHSARVACSPSVSSLVVRLPSQLRRSYGSASHVWVVEGLSPCGFEIDFPFLRSGLFHPTFGFIFASRPTRRQSLPPPRLFQENTSHLYSSSHTTSKPSGNSTQRGLQSTSRAQARVAIASWVANLFGSTVTAQRLSEHAPPFLSSRPRTSAIADGVTRSQILNGRSMLPCPFGSSRHDRTLSLAPASEQSLQSRL
jgi:hypothetical protein